MGQDSVSGKICETNNVNDIIKANNEIGCHTYNHMGALEQSPKEFENSLVENQKHLEKYFPQVNFEVFAYPKGQITVKTKRIVQKYYKCSRSTQPGINYGNSDFNSLFACKIYGNEKNFLWAKNYIDKNQKVKGWLVFYTHDVSENPSAYGCTPSYLEKVIRYSIETGATICTMKNAYKIFESNLLLD